MGQRPDGGRQVHAHNVLRALFRDSILAAAMLPYVPDGLALALDGFDSERCAQHWRARARSAIGS